MNIEKGPSLIEKQPDKSEIKIPAASEQSNLERLASDNSKIDTKQMEKKNQKDQLELAEIRASLDIEQSGDDKPLRQHLQQYLELKEGDVERIKLLKAKDLSENYKIQYEALKDQRLADINIAVIPDDLWVKGNQPSESSAENQLISIKQSYFEAQENPDEIAWMLHELAHCQNFLDSESPEDYNKKMQTYAFDDLKTEYTYPNNSVEQDTFTKQFQYLKEQGKSREDVLGMIDKYYDEEDFPFFNRLLDSVYG